MEEANLFCRVNPAQKCRMFRPNRALWWVIGSAVTALVLTLYIEPLRTIFQFAPLDATQLLSCALPGLVLPAAVMLAKSILPSQR